jgi:hypothetical protein
MLSYSFISQKKKEFPEFVFEPPGLILFSFTGTGTGVPEKRLKLRNMRTEAVVFHMTTQSVS